MKTLKGEHISLRALESSDLEFLYALENDEGLWEISNTTQPYSKYVLQQYLDNAHRDIYEVKQLRLVICAEEDNRPIGFVDLFDFEPKHRRAGVGIVVFNPEDRGKGMAMEALELLQKYAAVHLNLHQLYANITNDNQKSIELFEKVGYKKAGVKKDWILANGKYKDEWLYQLILEK
ncbi:GNAT family N-acetyltransferase [Rasiella rasia]|uniref:GNAT family N-acetyltransferase n=1 Tax=Rasiella rasia TaxID=2744027 RepID=A0A6G6GSK3_9FLAO|nr:GNAT family protein [Rasiella rasia]QIE60691.1 GNAT family N-acetyltransferase [Rasiella rasia]